MRENWRLFFVKMVLKNVFLYHLFSSGVMIFSRLEERWRTEKSNLEILDSHPLISAIANLLAYYGDITFRVPNAMGASGGNYWIFDGENPPGKYIEELFLIGERSRQYGMWLSFNVATGYQKVIREYLKANHLGNPDPEESEIWFWFSFLKWSGPLVLRRKLRYQELIILVEDFEEVISQRGGSLWGYAHGNIIGDHLYLTDDGCLFLFGSRVIPRMGGLLYDFIRIPDWIFLKTPTTEESFKELLAFIRKILFDKDIGSIVKQSFPEYDENLVKLIIAYRFIGIGWDVLHRGDWGRGDKEKKLQYLLKFIRREWEYSI